MDWRALRSCSRREQVRILGMAETFTRELSSASSTAGVRTELTTLTSPLNNWGYKLTTQSDSAFTYESHVPTVVRLGARAHLRSGPSRHPAAHLLDRDQQDHHVVLEERTQGSKLLVQGRGPGKVREAFQQMQL